MPKLEFDPKISLGNVVTIAVVLIRAITAWNTVVNRHTYPFHMREPLNRPGVTTVHVRCWNCEHTVDLTPDQLPAENTRHGFERRAKCRKCGGALAERHDVTAAAEQLGAG